MNLELYELYKENRMNISFTIGADNYQQFLQGKSVWMLPPISNGHVGITIIAKPGEITFTPKGKGVLVTFVGPVKKTR